MTDVWFNSSSVRFSRFATPICQDFTVSASPARGKNRYRGFVVISNSRSIAMLFLVTFMLQYWPSSPASFIVQNKRKRKLHTFLTGGMVQDPLRIDGLSSLGQYIRNIRMNSPAGAGSQFDSRSAPVNPSACGDRSSRPRWSWGFDEH